MFLECSEASYEVVQKIGLIHIFMTTRTFKRYTSHINVKGVFIYSNLYDFFFFFETQ